MMQPTGCLPPIIFSSSVIYPHSIILLIAFSPIYKIRKDVRELGFNLVGKSAIHKILKNPVYAGCQHVKPYKEMPGGLCPIKNHDCIVDFGTWEQVQKKLNIKDRPFHINF